MIGTATTARPIDTNRYRLGGQAPKRQDKMPTSITGKKGERARRCPQEAAAVANSTGTGTKPPKEPRAKLPA